MKNQERTREKTPRPASVKSVYELAGELRKCTSDPGKPSSYASLTTEGEGGHELSTVIFWLIDEILGLPSAKIGFEESFVHAEAESLQAACEIFEVWQNRFNLDPSNEDVRTQLEIAMINMDKHTMRFRILARSIIDI